MKEVLGNMKNIKDKRMCWQDGRLFEDKEDWVVDSCTKCTCQVGRTVTYDEWERKSERQPAFVLTLYVIWLYVAGIKDCMPSDHMSSSILCHPHFPRW